MPLSTLSVTRPFTSYARIQGWIGALVRNRRFQLSRAGLAGRRYLDLGCGPNTHADYINLDYQWRPGIDVCWDVSRGLPFADGSMVGVFSEHCLEHFAPAASLELLREIRRVLAPAGRLRLVVPDAELYLRIYHVQRHGDGREKFPYQDEEAKDPRWTPLASVNRVFYQDRESPAGHRQMYDFQSLAVLLRECGFGSITRCAFGIGTDPRLLIDTPARARESLYVEAAKA